MSSLARHGIKALVFALANVLATGICHAAITPLTPQQCQRMQEKKTIRTDNPVPCERLTQVSFAYSDFHGKRHENGLMVVLDALAPQVQQIFDTLLARGFALQQAVPMENFAGDDQASMQANNSSAFNGRAITGGNEWSKHAYGVAIDINPRQNPYRSHNSLLPAAGAAYAVRTPLRPGMAENVKDVFFRHGFLVWGGNWHEPTDYQHFEIGSRAFIATLLALPPSSARQLFTAYAASYSSCRQANPGNSADACARQSRR